MINILIAEDESMEMEAMKNDVDYASLGMEIVGTAYNGKKALELVEQLKPDILITDIQRSIEEAFESTRTKAAEADRLYVTLGLLVGLMLALILI